MLSQQADSSNNLKEVERERRGKKVIEQNICFLTEE